MADLEELNMGQPPQLSPQSPLSVSLARCRDRLNARVAEHRFSGGGFDSAEFGQLLVHALAPVVAAVSRVAPEQQDHVTESLFELLLRLLGRDLLGPRTHFAYGLRVFSQLLPELPRLVAESPHETAAALFNASLGVWQELRDRVELWLNEMSRLAPCSANLRELRALGAIVAWRSGLAHAREAALAAWETLPEPLARQSLGWPPELSRALVRQHYADPFCVSSTAGTPATLILLTSVGGFRGFGGVFLRPPRVWVSGGHLLAGDGERAYCIHADCFGCTLRGALHWEPPAETGTPVAIDATGSIRFRGLTAHFPTLAGHSGYAALPHLVAVVFPQSHRVALVARVGYHP